MAQTQTLQVRIDAAINAEATLKTLRELKQLQKETVAGSADYKKIQARINDIGDAAKTAKGQSEDWIDALAGAGGPIGALGRGLDTITSSTNKFGLALKATGIGLIVAFVGQLAAAFTSNEKAMKKLEPIMIAFEQILGGIFAALEPVFDLFVDLVEWVMPGLQLAIGGIYTAFAAFGSFLKNFFVVQVKNFMAFGKILKGVFTLDFEAIKEGVSDIVNNIKEGVKNVVDTTTGTWDRYNKGLKETTKTQKKNLEEQNKAQADAVAKQKENIEGLLKTREADLAKQKAIALDAAKTEEDRLSIEKKFAQDSYNAKKKALEDIQQLYPKSSKEYKDYTAQLTSLEAEYINKKTEFRNKDKELAQKAFQDEVKAAQDANKKKVDDLTSTYNKQKELYGENSKQARDAQDAIFKAQQEGLEAERKLYESKKELTKEEKARLEDIINAEKNLTNNIIIENERRRKADLDAKLKKAEQAKADSDKEFERIFQANQLNLEEQGRLLEEKKKKDEKYFADQLALVGLTDEQRKALEDKRLENQQFYVEKEGELEQKRVQQKLQALDAIISITGAESAVGRAALIAKQLLMAKELVMEVKKTIAFSTQAAARSTVAVAEGTAQTAKVGFPQNIPLLIGYAAQAVGIISAIVSAVRGAKQSANEAGGGGTEATPPDNNPSVPRPRGMATGGLVQGPGGPTSDLIPTMLSNGESVINAKSTSMFLPLLSSINAIGGGKRFAEGGLALSSFSQQSMTDLQAVSQVAPIKTYVVSSDMSSQQQLDRAIKSRSTL